MQFNHNHFAGGEHADILIGSTQTIGNNHRCPPSCVSVRHETAVRSAKEEWEHKARTASPAPVCMSGKDKVGIRYSDILGIVGRMRQQNHKIIR